MIIFFIVQTFNILLYNILFETFYFSLGKNTSFENSDTYFCLRKQISKKSNMQLMTAIVGNVQI